MEHVNFYVNYHKVKGNKSEAWSSHRTLRWMLYKLDITNAGEYYDNYLHYRDWYWGK